jgi:hypothetical protein
MSIQNLCRFNVFITTKKQLSRGIFEHIKILFKILSRDSTIMAERCFLWARQTIFMTYPIFPSFSITNYKYLAAGVLLSSLFFGNNTQAQVTLYVAETVDSTDAASLVEYNFNTVTDSALQVGSFAVPAGVTGGVQADESALQLSGDGSLLSYAGFNGTSTTGEEVLFNPATNTYTTPTTATSTVEIHSNFTESGNGFYVGGNEVTGSPGFVSNAGGAATPLTSSAESVNTITYNSASNNLYYTRVSSTPSASGIYTFTVSGQGGQGLVTSSTAVTQLSGTGGSTLNGLGFLGAGTIFAANITNNSLEAFTSATPNSPTSWGLSLTLNLGAISTTNETIQQLSVDQIDATDALIFFTTDGSATAGSTGIGGTSTFDEVSYNSSTGFGTVNVLGSSTTDAFTGVADIGAVPEPSTYVLFGFGLGLMSLILICRKTGRGIFLG